MLIDALSVRGAGARTRAGYGVFKKDDERQKQEEAERQAQEEAERQAQERSQKTKWKKKPRNDNDGRDYQRDDRRIEDLEHQLERFKKAEDQQARRGIRERVKEAANRLTGDDFKWTDADERESAAKALEECYNEIGWYDPGRNRRQRERQENRRRADIERIRQADE